MADGEFVLKINGNKEVIKNHGIGMYVNTDI
jgi:hypothetical protein